MEHGIVMDEEGHVTEWMECPGKGCVVCNLKAEVVRLKGRTVEAFVLARLEMEMIDHSLPPDLHDQALRVIAELRRNRRDLGGGLNAAFDGEGEEVEP